MLLASLIACVVLPESARASCSSPYVSSRSHFAGATVDVDLLRSAGALPSSDAETPRKPPAPCSGAFCSGTPAPLSSAIPPASIEIGEDWAIPAAAVPPQDPGLSSRSRVDSVRRPVSHASPIFRPPPASAAPLAS